MQNVEPTMLSQSHSSLDKFATCPRQFEATYITKEVTFVDTVASLFGRRTHKALEDYLAIPSAARTSDDLPKELQLYKPIIDQVIEYITGVYYIENKFAVDPFFNEVGYNERSLAGFRAICDLVVHNEDEGTLHLVDWKTGKIKAESQQLKMSAAILFNQSKFRSVHTITTTYAYLKFDKLIRNVYSRDSLKELQRSLYRRVIPVVAAYDSGVFIPTPNGLCRNYCPVTRCEFHGRGRR